MFDIKLKRVDFRKEHKLKLLKAKIKQTTTTITTKTTTTTAKKKDQINFSQ